MSRRGESYWPWPQARSLRPILVRAWVYLLSFATSPLFGVCRRAPCYLIQHSLSGLSPLMSLPAGYVARPLEERDLPAIVELLNFEIANNLYIWRTNLETLETRKAWYDAITNNHYPAVGVFENNTDGPLVGYANLGPYSPEDCLKYTVEIAVCISPPHHKRGIGRYLVQEMSTLGREAGYAGIIAHIADVNISSMALFSKEGFVKVGQLPMIGFKYGKWMDLTVWHKDIRTALTPS